MPEVELRRKKPAVIPMLLFDGTNGEQVDDFADGQVNFGRTDGQIEIWNAQEKAWQVVPVGHRVVKSTLGEFYPMSPKAYEETTEPDNGEIAGLRSLLAEVCDDIEHVVNGNAGYIDRDMLWNYRERADLEQS